VLRTAAESDLRLRATNAPSATITNSATVFLQIGKPNNAMVKLASPLFGTSVAVVVWRMFKTWREKSYTDCVPALIANVDEETSKLSWKFW